MHSGFGKDPVDLDVLRQVRLFVRIALCTATRDRPSGGYLAALEASVALLDAAGIEHAVVYEVGCPYISWARATMLRKAMQWGADSCVFIDDDVSWAPGDLLKLMRTEGDVVGGTYRYKLDDERYMGNIRTDERHRPIVRSSDGAILAYRLPAGFLKVTRKAWERFMVLYPALNIEKDGVKSPDLFNHGAINSTWFGEDMAFCLRWILGGGDLWLVPDLDLMHNGKDRIYPGNFHLFLRRQPGGDLAAA